MPTESRGSSLHVPCTETGKVARSSTGLTRLPPRRRGRGVWVGGADHTLFCVYIIYVCVCLCRWMKAYKDNNPQLDRASMVESLEAVRDLAESKRVFCLTCSQLLPSSSISPDHTPHQMKYGVEDTLLTQPTKLLTPQDNNKSNAVSFSYSQIPPSLY